MVAGDTATTADDDHRGDDEEQLGQLVANWSLGEPGDRDQRLLALLLPPLVSGQQQQQPLSTKHSLDPKLLTDFVTNQVPLLPAKTVAEILSLLSALLKKSLQHLESCKSLFQPCLKLLVQQVSKDAPASGGGGGGDEELLVTQLLAQLCKQLLAYSPSLEDVKQYLLALKRKPRLLVPLLCCGGSDSGGNPVADPAAALSSSSAFFQFGANGQEAESAAGLSLPPVARWPPSLQADGSSSSSTAWSFCCWVRLEPSGGGGGGKTSATAEANYLYYVRGGRDLLGYSAHFASGRCLVLTSMKVKGKGFQHCVPHEFVPFRWYHVCLVYSAATGSLLFGSSSSSSGAAHSNGGGVNGGGPATGGSGRHAAAVSCYVDGHLVDRTEINWLVSDLGSASPGTGGPSAPFLFDKCFIGCSGKGGAGTLSGQLAPVFIFDAALSAAQVCGLHRLGPGYAGLLQSADELLAQASGGCGQLPEGAQAALYGSRLRDQLVSCYSPRAVDGPLVLQLCPGSSLSHALLLLSPPTNDSAGSGGGVVVVRSLSERLLALGGLRTTLGPLLLDAVASGDSRSLEQLFGLCCRLLVGGPSLDCGGGGGHALGHVAQGAQLLPLLAAGLLALSRKQLSALLGSGSSFVHSLLALIRHLVIRASSASSSTSGSSSRPEQVLLKQLLDCFLFNSFLWTSLLSSSQGGDSTLAAVYSFMGHDLLRLSSPSPQSSPAGPSFLFASEVRRVSTVLQVLHALKHHFRTGTTGGHSGGAVRMCRQQQLSFLRQLLVSCSSSSASSASSSPLDDEVQALLNYLLSPSSAEESSTGRAEGEGEEAEGAGDDLLDVLDLVDGLLVDQAASMVPAFDAKHGVSVLLALMMTTGGNNSSRSGPDQARLDLRLVCLRILATFLGRSTAKRKADVMGPQNLFSLLGAACGLQSCASSASQNQPLCGATYAALMQVCLESPLSALRSACDPAAVPRLENPLVLKVIASALSSCESSTTTTATTTAVKRAFLKDLWRLLVTSRENRRLLLQMSVWQHWLIGLIDDGDHAQQLEVAETVETCGDQVLGLFQLLLYHAVKFEYGGWRVWIDTLAILHSKVSLDSFSRRHHRQHETKEEQEGETEEATAGPAYRVPEFRWSGMHLALLGGLLDAVEADLGQQQPSSSTSTTAATISAENGATDPLEQQQQVYLVNVVHLVSQMADNVVLAAGGLLPTLAQATAAAASSSQATTTAANQQAADSATAATTAGDGLQAPVARALLGRLCRLVDLLVLQGGSAGGANGGGLQLQLNLGDLEQEKNMASGGLMRQVLRLVAMHAVLHCGHDDHDRQQQQEGEGSGQPEPVLRPVDVARLRAAIYRDSAAASGQGGVSVADTSGDSGNQFLALATVYCVSVLCVSRYRDAIEQLHLQSSSSTIASTTTTTTLTVSERLDLEVGHCVQLLRELLGDFEAFLSRTLVGSQGQQLLTRDTQRLVQQPQGGGSLQLVMLLCSQEWQNSLQKHAGLAFIELVNEGRLLSHAMKDHVVRVALEADFILDRLRADDVLKHQEFARAQARARAAGAKEDQLVHSLILAARRRHHDQWAAFVSSYASESSCSSSSSTELRLDCWEDDLRRRRRFLPIGAKRVLPLVSSGSTAHATTEVEKTDEKTDEEMEDSDDDKQKREAAHRLHSASAASSGPAPTGGGNHQQQQQSSSSNSSAASSSGEEEEELEDDEGEADSAAADQRQPWVTNHQQRRSSKDGRTLAAAPEVLLLPPAQLVFEDTLFVWQGVTCPGTLSVAGDWLLFEPSTLPLEEGLEPEAKERQLLDSCCDFFSSRGRRLALGDIRAIFSRRYLHRDGALELFVSWRTSLLFFLGGEGGAAAARRLVKALPAVGVGTKYGVPQSRKASLSGPRALFAASNMTGRWQRRQVSNFEYLMFVNTVAGRSLQDLSQYPVFPWVLSNYDSAQLDLEDCRNFRDLSKPVGALNAARAAQFRAKWEGSGFHYGTHYSTAYFTLGWLHRVYPFDVLFSLYQGDTGRLPDTMAQAWASLLTGNNFKELIPECFYLEDVFGGGALGGGAPPYCGGDWAAFVRLHRLALESDLVSCQLHQWIDLVFGYKQQGPEAVRALNTFYPTTYGLQQQQQPQQNGAKGVSTEVDRAELEQARHFGICPGQLLLEPHPPRPSQGPAHIHHRPQLGLAGGGGGSGGVDELVCRARFPSINAPISFLGCSAGPSNQSSSSSSSSVAPPERLLVAVTRNLLVARNTLQQQPVVSAGGQLELVLDPKPQRLDKQAMGLFSWLQDTPTSVVFTSDARFLFAAPFLDHSFRIFSLEATSASTSTSAAQHQLVQTVYGHRAPVVGLARSEANSLADCYVASASQDGALYLWTWNAAQSRLEAGPRLALGGHSSPVRCMLLSAELGLLVSCSARDGLLCHKTTTSSASSSLSSSWWWRRGRGPAAVGAPRRRRLQCPTAGAVSRAGARLRPGLLRPPAHPGPQGAPRAAAPAAAAPWRRRRRTADQHAGRRVPAGGLRLLREPAAAGRDPDPALLRPVAGLRAQSGGRRGRRRRPWLRGDGDAAAGRAPPGGRGLPGPAAGLPGGL